MEKSKDIQLYVLTHKIPPYGLQDDEYHTPIHCGSALSSTFVCETRDDSGDNISEKNPWFLETTGTYWIWKNTNEPYVGNYQFRRHIDVDPKQIPGILSGNDIIVARSVGIGVSVYEQYKRFHIESDLDLCKKIIDEKYPEYSLPYDYIIKTGRVLYYSNGFITTRENYNNICKFVFGILFEYEKRMGFKSKDEWVKHGATKLVVQNSHPGELTAAEYQSRVCGYLFERLFTLYVIKNFPRRVEVPYTLMEKSMML